jgi:hypothetical protein
VNAGPDILQEECLSLARQYRMIRVPASLHARLARLASEMLMAKAEGRGYDDVPFAEQGKTGTWIPLYAVIDRALDEFEGHRKRSNRHIGRRAAETPQRRQWSK